MAYVIGPRTSIAMEIHRHHHASIPAPASQTNRFNENPSASRRRSI